MPGQSIRRFRSARGLPGDGDERLDAGGDPIGHGDGGPVENRAAVERAQALGGHRGDGVAIPAGFDEVPHEPEEVSSLGPASVGVQREGHRVDNVAAVAEGGGDLAHRHARQRGDRGQSIADPRIGKLLGETREELRAAGPWATSRVPEGQREGEGADGEVTLADLGILASNFGANGPIPQAEFEAAVEAAFGVPLADLIPEPGALGILAVGAVMMWRRRH